MNERDAENRVGDGPGPREIPLPGGGVLRGGGASSATDEAPSVEPRFAEIVQPFWLMALVALGVVPNPDTEQTLVDLRRASESIAVLELLREKTRGRLDEGEQRLLDQAIYELKMQFVGLQDRSGRS